MLVEVCDICKQPLSYTDEEYKNNFKVKVKLTQKISEWDGTYRKKFKLCNHCKTAIAIAIKEYSEFMRTNEQSNIIPKFYTVENQEQREIKYCRFPNTMKIKCIWHDNTECTYDKECENQVIYNIPK